MSDNIIAAPELYNLIKSGAEFALIDVREQGIHAQGHPLFAASIPLSRIELEIERLVPRKAVLVVLMDQGGADNLAQRADQILKDFGYTNVARLENGIAGWHEAGFELFSGINVPSKAFGEFVEHECQTPHIDATELARRLGEGEEISIFDSRPFEEYNRMCIPGGIDMPGAELVHRITANVKNESVPIVVNCAGRTRSIIGAQSLRNAGVRNEIMALKDGTMGWYLSGFETEKGAERIAAVPTDEQLAEQTGNAREFAVKCGVRYLKPAEFDKMMHESVGKTTYLLDVRTLEEFEQGHIKGSQHAPGGQLVQATDEYVAVRSANLILIDDRQVRAWMTASWLRQMGWTDVYVFSELKATELEKGVMAAQSLKEWESLSAMELDAVLQSGEPVAVLDFSTSLQYRKSHIPGACWVIRSRIERDLMLLPPVGLIIATAEDERMAHLAAPEIREARPEVIVRVLKGGNPAWRREGRTIETGDTRQLSPAEDVWYKPYDNKDKVRERMQEYLEWEVGLISQIKRDATASFQIMKTWDK